MSLSLLHLLALPVGLFLVFGHELGWRWAVMSGAAWMMAAGFLAVHLLSCGGDDCGGGITFSNLALGVTGAYWVSLLALVFDVKALFKTITAVLGLPAALLFIDTLATGW